MQNILKIVIISILLFAVSTSSAAETGNLTISRDGKTIKSVKVEVVKTPAEHARGLMFRKKLPENYGMFFIFDSDRETPFWMKNTYISLDIIFINKEKKIVSIARSTTPLSEKQIYSRKQYRYVLEVPAGFSDSFQIKTGDVISE